MTATPVQTAKVPAALAFDGVIEAVRQTVVAAQVPGAVEIQLLFGKEHSSFSICSKAGLRTDVNGQFTEDAICSVTRVLLVV